jgi:REP element-mobilizing transposase RayT
MQQQLAPAARRHAHSSTTLLVHVVWSTHRRAPWIDRSYDRRLGELLETLAKRIACEAIAVGNATDHVHVLVGHPPSVAVSDIVHRLKGASARSIHAALPQAAGHVWQVGYWAESIGPSELPGVTRYVRDQRVHHDGRGAATEPWEATNRDA